MSTRFEPNPGGYAVIECETCGLVAKRYVEDEGYAFNPSIRAFQADMASVGWTFWGSRSLRTYCPDHKPKPGHKMRDLTDAYAKGA